MTAQLGRPERFENGIWWHGYRQAKDIPDQLLLAAVDITITITGRSATRWDVEAILGGQPIPRESFNDDIDGVPSKVVLAKARRLIKRGLLKGCDCGCRGDWTPTTTEDNA